MKTRHVLSRFLLPFAAIALAGVGILAGCNAASSHPDYKSAVTSSLNSNSLSNISVSQDQEKGVITLTGDVSSQDQKTQAESLAKQSAPGYTIANEIGVRPAGIESQASSVSSNLDKGIEDNFKAALKGHKNLDDQSIDYSAKNGTLVLKGSVKTASQRKEAGDLAKHVPNVQQVVNEIEVKPGKHSTASS